MNDDPMSLTDFLLARIAEDEQAARAAASDVAELDRVMTDDDAEPWGWRGWSRPGASLASMSEPVKGHIARWDPARVLTECRVKRWIIDWHASGGHADDDPVLWALAEPYRDHPDFSPVWGTK